MGRVHRWGLRLIIALFVSLAGTSSVVVPPFETPDEIWHFAYIQHLASGGSLPVLEPQTEARWRQQGGQAPLYYVTVAMLTSFVDQSDFPELYARANPHAAIGAPETADNHNFIAHDPADGWPWQGSILALHIARFFSVFLGAVTLWATFQTLHLVAGAGIALLGVALLAFIPQFVFISGAASNDNAITALSALVLWRLVSFLREAPETPTAPDASNLTRPWRAPRPYLILGVILGLALLSKLSALALVFLTISVLVVTGTRAGSWRVPLQGGLLVLAVAGLISGWWFARNWMLYGDWLAINIWEANVEARLTPLEWPALVGEVRGLGFSFWGLFGWFNIMYPAWLYLLFLVAGLLVVTGLFIASVRYFRWHRVGRWASVTSAQWLAGAVLVAWLVALSASWISFMRVTFAAQGRLFFPAAPAIALLMALGLGAWRWRPGQPPLLAWGVVVGLFVLSVVTPWWVIRPVYLPSPVLAALPADVVPLGARFDDRMILEGYRVEPGVLAPAGALDVTLYWRALREIEEPLSISVKGFVGSREGSPVARHDSYPDGGRWPTPAWEPGDLITDRRTMQLSEAVTPPVAVQVTVDVYHFDRGLDMLPATLDGEAVSLPIPFTEVVVRQQDDVPALASTYPFRPLVRSAVIHEDRVAVDFVWEVGQALPEAYQAFFHLTPALDVPPVKQADFEPLGGRFPTRYWWPGDVLEDRAEMVLPSDVAAGDYLLVLGLYDLEDGARVTNGHDGGAWPLARVYWDGRSWRVEDSPAVSSYTADGHWRRWGIVVP